MRMAVITEKKKITVSVGEDMEKLELPVLLLGMENGTATVEKEQPFLKNT